MIFTVLATSFLGLSLYRFLVRAENKRELENSYLALTSISSVSALRLLPSRALSSVRINKIIQTNFLLFQLIIFEYFIFGRRLFT